MGESLSLADTRVCSVVSCLLYLEGLHGIREVTTSLRVTVLCGMQPLKTHTPFLPVTEEEALLRMRLMTLVAILVYSTW